jgi:inorganic pyrophosphatase-like protein
MLVTRRYEFCGLPIAVENAAGTIRTWNAGEGKTGYTRMLLDYGFIEGYLSGDGEELDVYIGPDPEAKMVHVVHQLLAPEYRKHDEDKVMLGFSSADSARVAFLAHRDDGERAFGGMSIIPLDIFRAKLRRRKPETTSKIHAAADLTRRSLMLLAGRPRPEGSARRTVAGRKRAARYQQRLVDRGIELASRVLAPDLAGLADEIAEADSFADLRKRIIRAYRGMEVAELGELLRKVAVLAHLSGRASALEEV